MASPLPSVPTAEVLTVTSGPTAGEYLVKADHSVTAALVKEAQGQGEVFDALFSAALRVFVGSGVGLLFFAFAVGPDLLAWRTTAGPERFFFAAVAGTFFLSAGVALFTLFHGGRKVGRTFTRAGLGGYEGYLHRVTVDYTVTQLAQEDPTPYGPHFLAVREKFLSLELGSKAVAAEVYSDLCALYSTLQGRAVNGTFEAREQALLESRFARRERLLTKIYHAELAARGARTAAAEEVLKREETARERAAAEAAAARAVPPKATAVQASKSYAAAQATPLRSFDGAG